MEKRGEVGWIIFSRPERMNALAPESMRELWGLLAELEADTSIRVAAFTGQGEDAFCAGMDMVGMEKATPLAARRRSREIQVVLNRIADFSLPTVAAVNGVAVGLGLEICLACDLAVASRAARFAFPEVRLGMIPCGGGTQRLARLVGLRRARDMILTGRVLDAEQALEWSLVNAVTGADELEREVGELAKKMARGGRVALYQAKRCLNHCLDMDLGRGMEYETECFTTCFASGEPSQILKRLAMSEGEPEEWGGEREEASPARKPASPPAKDEVTCGAAAGEAEDARAREEKAAEPVDSPASRAEEAPQESAPPAGEEDEEDIFE